jgi:hypothetical protein
MSVAEVILTAAGRSFVARWRPTASSTASVSSAGVRPDAKHPGNSGISAQISPSS